MSGHNKWSTIKHKKGAADAKRGKAFSRLAKEIMLAARTGGKAIDANPRLRSAVTAAKAINMPNDNIERAIKKGVGELEGGSMEELCYEAYGQGGVAIIVDCLTDNRNRTAAEVRNIINKGNGNLAESGAVSRMFNRKAKFVIEGENADEERLMELCFDAEVDVDDIAVDDGRAELLAPTASFDALVTMFENSGIEPVESGISRVPELEVPVDDLATARGILRLLDNLEDNDDVQSVVANANIADELLEQLSNE